MKIDMKDMVSVSEASTRGMSRMVAEAEAGREWVILRSNKPAAAVISVQRLQRLRELEEREAGIGEVVTAVTRMLLESQDAVSLDSLRAELGIAKGDLDRPATS